jgi:hypothetical protein
MVICIHKLHPSHFICCDVNFTLEQLSQKGQNITNNGKEFQAPTHDDYFATAFTFCPSDVTVFNIIILPCFLEDPAWHL